MNYLSLSVAALIPVLLLCWYIYEKDRMEKEPIGLLAILFAAGAVLFIPTIYVENALIGVVDKMMESQMEFSLTGVSGFVTEVAHIQHSLLCGFLAIALVEEGLKWLLLFLLTSKNKNFDHLFDGVVYAVFLSLGFAAMENVFYAVRDGWSVFILRSLTSVPGHMTFGVLMGFGYTMWHTYLIAKDMEKRYAAEGTIKVEKPFHSAIWLIASVALPLILHGFYSFMKLYTSDIMVILFYAFIVILYILCFIAVRRLSASDNEDDLIAFNLLIRRYPVLKKTRNKSLNH